MIDIATVKRLLEQLGFNALDLSEFSQAVIEDYKLSLVPVGYFLHESYDGTDEYNQTDPTVHNAIPLYALGETE